jgi:hypothetical protein
VRPIELDLNHPDLRGIELIDLPLALVTCASAGVVISESPSSARSGPCPECSGPYP